MSSAADAEKLEGELNLPPSFTAHFKNPDGVAGVTELIEHFSQFGIEERNVVHVHQFPMPRPGGMRKQQEGYAVFREQEDVQRLADAFGSMMSVKPPTCHRVALRAKRNVNYVPLELLSVAPGQRVPITKMTQEQVTKMHAACNTAVDVRRQQTMRGVPRDLGLPFLDVSPDMVGSGCLLS